MADDLAALNARHEAEYQALLAQHAEQRQRARDREREIAARASSRFEARQSYRKRQAFVRRLEQQRAARKEAP